MTDKDTIRETPTPKNPIQPLVKDDCGVIRFKQNILVRALLDHGQATGLGLNELATTIYTNENVDDWQQLAQLIGYSLSGFGDLSYVDDATYYSAQAAKESSRKELEAAKRRITELETENEQLSGALDAKITICGDTTITALKAEKEALEKKLAERQAELLRHKNHSECCLIQTDGAEELTNQLAAARQQGFEEGRKLAVDTQQKLFDDGKQAGRDELQKKQSEQEPVGYLTKYTGKLLNHQKMIDGHYSYDTIDCLIPRPSAPVKGE